jgi:predicted dehydrogenase
MKGQPESTKSFGTTTIFKDVIETEDNFVGIMKFADDGLAVISSTNTSVDQWDSKIELIGTRGKITFSTGFPTKILDFQHEDDVAGERILKELRSLEETDDLPPTMNYYGTSHREQLEDFFAVIEGKRIELKMSPTEARNTLAVVTELYKYN